MFLQLLVAATDTMLGTSAQQLLDKRFAAFWTISGIFDT
jgi:hypothetical protein